MDNQAGAERVTPALPNCHSHPISSAPACSTDLEISAPNSDPLAHLTCFPVLPAASTHLGEVVQVGHRDRVRVTRSVELLLLPPPPPSRRCGKSGATCVAGGFQETPPDSSYRSQPCSSLSPWKLSSLEHCLLECHCASVLPNQGALARPSQSPTSSLKSPQVNTQAKKAQDTRSAPSAWRQPTLSACDLQVWGCGPCPLPARTTSKPWSPRRTI